MCYQLAKAGHSVAVHYRNSLADAEKVAAKCRSLGVEAEIIQGDFSSIDHLKAFTRQYLDRFHETKAVIHNVGAYLITPLLKTDLEAFESLFQTNFFTPFYLTKSLLPSLIRAKGCVIHIGQSGVGKGGPKRKAPAYFISKEALFQLTRSLALELAPEGVRVNMVSPGVMENSVDLEDNRKLLPMGRPGSLEEIASFAVFLLDEKNSYITGQNIEVAGGFGL